MLEGINIMKDDSLLILVKKLISIPSVYYHEEEIINYCASWLKNNGIQAKIMKYHEKLVIGYSGKNIISIIDSGKPGKTILLNGHLDTVPVCDGWSSDPFIPLEDNGCIYGLGSVDMKSGSAILMNVFSYLNRHKDYLTGRVILTLVSDEEGPYGLGADSLINDYKLPPIDLVISCEPSAAFSNQNFPVLCLGARGCFVYNVDFYGKSAHASQPESGINAAIEAAKFILESQKVQLESDEILGKGDFCILKVDSDGGACSVPEKARVTVHRHIVSFENEKYVINEAKNLIKKANINVPYKISLRPEPSLGARYYKPYYVDKNNSYTKKFIEIIKNENNGNINIDYFSSIGDFNYFATRLNNKNKKHPPTFIFGPDGGNFHKANEYVVVDTIYKTYNTILKYILEINGEK